MCMWKGWRTCMCPYVPFTAYVRSAGAFELVNVNTCVFILYLCRVCWLHNILSGHVKCERNRAQDVQLWPSACSQSTHTPSLPHSLIHMLAHSFLFPPSLPLAPRLCLCHCTATHDIMGLLLCFFCLTVTSIHSALIQWVFVLRHLVKIASVHTCMRKRVTMWVIPVMQYLLCIKVTYLVAQPQKEVHFDIFRSLLKLLMIKETQGNTWNICIIFCMYFFFLFLFYLKFLI